MQTVTKTNQPRVLMGHAARRWRLGFVPLTDCAPLVVAQELGLFSRHGLEVALSRELGWASVRDKLAFGELQAAHALGPMVLQLALGLTANPCACFTPLILSAQGNSITLSQQLWHAGARTASSLRQWHAKTRRGEPLTFGIVFPFSYHHFLLRDWLAAAGVQVDREVKLVVVPPPQMVTNLRAGHLDGFCAGEPWGTLAEETGAGRCVARSAELAAFHPEKVLVIRQELLVERRDECLALTLALFEACTWCADPANTKTLAGMLAQPRYLNVSRAAVLNSLCAGNAGGGARHLLFHGPDLNDPTADKAGGLAHRLRQAGLLSQPLPPARLNTLFRSDLFQAAVLGRIPFVTHESKIENEIAFATS